MFEPTLDPNFPMPLYHQLKEILRDKIGSGEWAPGQLIPTENELIRQYKVSRTTVREAVTALVNEGKLEKKQGKGTLVCDPKIKELLGRLTGFTEEMLSRGLVPGAKVIQVMQMKAPDTVRERLFPGADKETLFIQRIRLADGKPISIEQTYWPLEVARYFANEDFSTAAFYPILEKNGIHLRDADETISSAVATKSQASLLGIATGSPLLRIERLTYTTSGEPVEYCVNDYRSDRYEYRIHLHR
jgi:GntR family transcriptional regulator